MANRSSRNSFGAARCSSSSEAYVKRGKNDRADARGDL
jgi:hypothetical protein